MEKQQVGVGGPPFFGGTLPETNGSHLTIDPWKRKFLLETTIFRGYVSFGECNKKIDSVFFLGENMHTQIIKETEKSGCFWVGRLLVTKLV